MKIEDTIPSSILLPSHKKLLLNIMYIQNVLNDYFGEIVKHHGLSIEQFNVLSVLKDQNTKPANMHMIQEGMITRTSNTTRLIDKLLQKGLVTRKICPKDRRKTEISITQEGLLLFEDIEPMIVNHEIKLAGNLTGQEIENLNFLLEKYKTNLKQ